MVIGGYFVNGYWWLLMVIILAAFGGYYINFLLVDILLVDIGGY
jgi:hypothetical protein